MQGVRLKFNSRKGWERKRKQTKRKGEVHRKSPLDQRLSFCLVDTLPRTNDP